jgi:hypothetical protein
MTSQSMTSFALVAALAAVLSLAGCGGAGGAAGDMAPALKSGQIDTTFGNSGSVVFAASEGFSDMAVAPDGAIYVTGRSVARLDSRGLVDLSSPSTEPVRSPSRRRIDRSSAANVTLPESPCRRRRS